MAVKIVVDAGRVVAAFKKCPGLMERRLTRAMKIEVLAVERMAKRNHRYISRSGHLERSISHGVENRGLTGKVYIDPSLTMTKKGISYGVFIHQGFKSWRADRFMTDALKKRTPEIKVNLKRALSEALRKAGF